MTVKEMIDELSKFDWNYEIEFQYFDEFWHNFISWPSIDKAMNIYEDEEWYEGHRVIIDLWNF